MPKAGRSGEAVAGGLDKEVPGAGPALELAWSVRQTGRDFDCSSGLVRARSSKPPGVSRLPMDSKYSTYSNRRVGWCPARLRTRMVEPVTCRHLSSGGSEERQARRQVLLGHVIGVVHRSEDARAVRRQFVPLGFVSVVELPVPLAITGRR